MEKLKKIFLAVSLGLISIPLIGSASLADQQTTTPFSPNSSSDLLGKKGTPAPPATTPDCFQFLSRTGITVNVPVTNGQRNSAGKLVALPGATVTVKYEVVDDQKNVIASGEATGVTGSNGMASISIPALTDIINNKCPLAVVLDVSASYTTPSGDTCDPMPGSIEKIIALNASNRLIPTGFPNITIEPITMSCPS